jgi:hypothetical protein
VLTNGYISWLEPGTQKAAQLLNFVDATGQPHAEIKNLSDNARFGEILEKEGIRMAIDRVTQSPVLVETITDKHREQLKARKRAVNGAANNHSVYLLEQIDSVIRNK